MFENIAATIVLTIIGTVVGVFSGNIVSPNKDTAAVRYMIGGALLGGVGSFGWSVHHYFSLVAL